MFIINNVFMRKNFFLMFKIIKKNIYIYIYNYFYLFIYLFAVVQKRKRYGALN